MIRTGLAALVMTLAILFAGAPAQAGRQLAIGAAGGIFLPEGARLRPVYVWPRGARWDPADVGDGYRFREPIYTTPRNYRYVYVRGYQIIPGRRHWVHRHYRPVKVSAVRVKKHRRAACVTDIGFGRYESCGR